jgi:uncharacterized protein DUF3455
MSNDQTKKNPIKRSLYLVANAAALAIALVTAMPQSARAADITPPAVPDGLGVDAGNEPFLLGHAIGTQNYVCLPQGTGFAFKLFTPQATLFADSNRQLITHFFSPNPEEGGTIRATWQHSKDSSAVWAAVLDASHSSFDRRFVEDGAVAWLKLTRVGSQDGTAGGDTLTDVTFVQRVNTHGGLAPLTGCSSLADVGRQAFQPYTADYIFYKKSEANTGY